MLALRRTKMNIRRLAWTTTAAAATTFLTLGATRSAFASATFDCLEDGKEAATGIVLRLSGSRSRNDLAPLELVSSGETYTFKKGARSPDGGRHELNFDSADGKEAGGTQTL